MQQSRFFLKSKTIQGILVTAIPLLMKLFGLEWSEELTADVAAIIDSAIGLGGLAWATYGRFRATNDGRKLAVNPLKGASAAPPDALGAMLVACLVLPLLLAACGTTAIQVAETPSQKADALLLTYRDALGTASTVVTNPSVPIEAVRAIQATVSVATPLAKALSAANGEFVTAEKAVRVVRQSGLEPAAESMAKLTNAATGLSRALVAAEPAIHDLAGAVAAFRRK